MPHTALFRRAVGAAVAGVLALAAPAAAEPVKAGPALPDELAVATIEGTRTNLTDQLSLVRLSTTDGSYRGRIGFPSTGDAPLTAYAQTATLPRGPLVKRSVDGQSVTIAAAGLAAGGTEAAAQNTWRAVKIGADATYTSVPFGALASSAVPAGAATIDGSRYWFARQTGAASLGTFAAGDSAATVLGAAPGSVWSVQIADGTLYAATGQGVYRVPGGGLPTVPNPAAMETVVSLSPAYDAAFVDTDGAGGSDTLYVSRNASGLTKFVRSGDTWVERGTVPGTYLAIAARAVAGAVEIYSTNGAAGTQIQKTVDTAESGATMVSTGPALVSRAPGNARYTGLAFAPGTGFTADSTPYPPAPPRITAGATTVNTVFGAKVKATLELDVSDFNTPASDLTVTATSNAAWALPPESFKITGTGNTRTVTIDPTDSVGNARATFTVQAGDDTASVQVTVNVYGAAPDPEGHYYLGVVDLSAALDVGGDYFLGISDEVNTPHLYRKGVVGSPVASFGAGFPSGESDFEGVTRFGNTVLWTASHGLNRSGAYRPERHYMAFSTITGSGRDTQLTFRNGYTRLWGAWQQWDATNGHGLGANKLKFNTATQGIVLPNAPNGWNVEGVTMAPGSSSVAWFGMRAPTITGDDGIERAVILPVNNIDQLTSDAVAPELGQPIFLDLGGRSIRDIAKNARDQYLIEAGTGDTDDSIKGWALYTWDGNPAHDPQMVKQLPTNEQQIGAWEGIAELPENLVPGSRVLLTADSGDTGIGRAYGTYVTLDEPLARPAAVTGVTAAVRAGAIDLSWNAAPGAERYRVLVRNAAGQNAPGTPFFTTGTSRTLEPLTAGTEWTVSVLTENYAARSASTPVKATPAEGPRTPTTVSTTLVGAPVYGEPLKLVATLSVPNARGTVAFFDGPYQLGAGGRLEVPVVDGKAELDVTGELRLGVRPVRARFTPANPEELAASESTTPFFVDYRPVQPYAELVSITGERVAGQPLTLTYKLRGYTKDELYPGPWGLGFTVFTRLDGAANATTLGAADFDPLTGEAKVTVTPSAGKHRIGGYTGNWGRQQLSFAADEVPVEIVPAGSPAPEVKPVKSPKVFLTVAGERVQGRPVTLTARVSDPTLQGTVQFHQDDQNSRLGDPVPVVNGIATWTGTIRDWWNLQLHARFEPAADRDTTVSPVSPVVTIFRDETQPITQHPETATTTTLAVEGSRVAGEPLKAKITVAPTVVAPFADHDLHGYIELTDNGQVLDLARVVRGQGELDLSGIGAGQHSLVARYVSSDEKRSLPSESAAQAVDVVVKTDAEGGTGGTVGATLALTLGTPAQFEPFIPGVAKEYTAATTANVISTAGDAALTVSEPGHLTNGAFSLAQPLRVELTPAAWTAPVSNGTVDITFKQAIGATDALRTGTYTKTLTFTLSTTTP